MTKSGLSTLRRENWTTLAVNLKTMAMEDLVMIIYMVQKGEIGLLEMRSTELML